MPVLIFVTLASLGALFMVKFLTALGRDGSRRHTYSAPTCDADDLLYPISVMSGRRGSPLSRKILTMQLATPTVSARRTAAENSGRVEARSR